MFDGLRTMVALPPLAAAILPLMDGQRSVGQIGATLAGRGGKPEVLRRVGGGLSRRWSGSIVCCCRAAVMLTGLAERRRLASMDLSRFANGQWKAGFMAPSRPQARISPSASRFASYALSYSISRAISAAASSP